MEKLNSAQINATVLQQSISEDGKLISTFELEYPRFIHSEFMTHRLFSRNAASSRAIKVEAMLKLVATNLAHPIHWGADQKGMQADVELSEEDSLATQDDWKRASEHISYVVNRMAQRGVHKQVGNRLLEPFTHIKVILTTTELDNFMALRDHKAAQPEIQALARAMKEAMEGAPEPMELADGEYHLPYIDRKPNKKGKLEYFVGDEKVSLEDALKISASACAQVSYRLLDLGLDKAKDIYQKLVGMKPIHASPFEHQATPIVDFNGDWPAGITHMDRTGGYWSGNFKGWKQQRHLLGEF